MTITLNFTVYTIVWGLSAIIFALVGLVLAMAETGAGMFFALARVNAGKPSKAPYLFFAVAFGCVLGTIWSIIQ